MNQMISEEINPCIELLRFFLMCIVGVMLIFIFIFSSPVLIVTRVIKAIFEKVKKEDK